MSDRWAPNGYSKPRKYEKNEWHIFAVAFGLIGLFGIAVWPPVIGGIEVYLKTWTGFADGLGITNSIIVGLGAALFAAGGIALLFRKIVVPIHEALHFGVGLLLNLNPDFGYEEGLFGTNPRVVALSVNIPVWKNLAMLLAPFAVIGFVSWGVVQISSGLIAGIAAVVLWINSAASAQDLYHYFRLIRMDPDTVFANFEEDGEIRTEYAPPKQ